MPRYTLHQLHLMDQEAFTNTLGSIFEHSPWIAAASWHKRPFTSLAALHRALYDTMLQASQEQQLALIRAHPDLAGKAALAGELTPESTHEQASAGLDRLSAEEFERFTRHNSAYQQRFGFPFIICVREHSKHSILAQFAERLSHTPEQEHNTALGEIAKIANLRLRDLIDDEKESINVD